MKFNESFNLINENINATVIATKTSPSICVAVKMLREVSSSIDDVFQGRDFSTFDEVKEHLINNADNVDPDNAPLLVFPGSQWLIYTTASGINQLEIKVNSANMIDLVWRIKSKTGSVARSCRDHFWKVYTKENAFQDLDIDGIEEALEVYNAFPKLTRIYWHKHCVYASTKNDHLDSICLADSKERDVCVTKEMVLNQIKQFIVTDLPIHRQVRI